MRRNRTTIVAVGLAVVLLLAAFAGTVTSEDPVTVELSPEQTEIQPGETATFDIVVTNVSAGVGAVNVTVDLQSESVGSVTQVALDDSSYDATVTYSENGTTATISGYGLDTTQTGSVVVGTVTVSGDADGTSDLDLRVNALGDEDGNDIQFAEVTGATLSVTTSSGGGGDDGDSPPGSGDGGDDGKTNVTSTTVSDITTSSDTVPAGETIDVAVTVTNDGNITTNRTVELRDNGDVQGIKTVTDLAPNETKTLEFRPSFETTGEHELTAGNLSATVTVIDQDTPTATDEPITTSTATTTETQAPGFGPLVALVALVAAVGVTLRSRAN